MSDPHELQDTLASIQEDIDETIALINRAVSGGPRGLLDVAQQLKMARESIASAQHLVIVGPIDNKATTTDQVKRGRPGPHGRDVTTARDWPTTTCPFCKGSVYAHQLQSHLIKLHHQPAPIVLPPKSKKKPKAKRAPKSQPVLETVLPKAPPNEIRASASNRASTTVPPLASTKLYETCPVCGVPVRQDRLGKHLAKVHPQTARALAPMPTAATRAQHSDSSSAKKPKAKHRSSVSAKSQAYLSSSDGYREESLEALDQSYRDRRDGGKELSQSRRDHGQYGSLPVHDDYSEDSFA